MAIEAKNKFAAVCDSVMVLSLCAMVFVLPASIALVDSFAGVAALFYLLKKINGIALRWPSKASSLNVWGKLRFIWKGFSPPPNVLNFPLRFLALAFFLSVVLSQYPGLSLVAFFGKFVKSVFIYFSFIESMSAPRRLRIFLVCFLFSALLTSLDGIYQHYAGKDLIKGRAIGTENSVSTHRISASFGGANAFGAYLLPVLGLVIHLFITAFSRRKFVMGTVWGILMALLLFCLCWTFSRSAWVGYLAVIAAIFVLDWRKWSFVAALAVIFSFVFLPFLGKIRHLELVKDSSKTSVFAGTFKPEKLLKQGGSGRLEYWETALSVLRASPVWGTGLNTYMRVLKRDRSRHKWWYAHNCYLQIAAETGILGISAFLWMLFVVLSRGFSDCRIIKDQERRSLLQGSVCGLFGFLVQSFFDNTFLSVQLDILLWLMIGLVIAVIRMETDQEAVL